MKFKSRLPLPSNPFQPASDDSEAQSEPRAVEAQSPESPAPAPQQEKGGPEALLGAFDAVAQVVRREIESLKRSVVGLESQLHRRMESEKEALNSAMSSLRQDMVSRMDELRQNQQKALAEMNEQTKASVVSLRGQFEQARQQADSRAVEIKAGLEQILTAKEQKLEKELDALTNSVSGMRVDLEQQVVSAGRVSALLNEVAQVFSDPKTMPKDPQAPVR